MEITSNLKSIYCSLNRRCGFSSKRRALPTRLMLYIVLATPVFAYNVANAGVGEVRVDGDAQSDEDAQILKSYSIDGDTITDNGIFYDATPLASDDAPGLPDGMCVAETGHIFATGPGGVLILSPKGKLLGRILAEKATANCAFGNDGKMLYITSSGRLGRIALKVKGLGVY